MSEEETTITHHTLKSLLESPAVLLVARIAMPIIASVVMVLGTFAANSVLKSIDNMHDLVQRIEMAGQQTHEDVAIIKQAIADRAQARDRELAAIQSELADHEARLRTDERKH